MKKICFFIFMLLSANAVNAMHQDCTSEKKVQFWNLIKRNKASQLPDFFRQNDAQLFVNSFNNVGLAPLHYAIQKGFYGVVVCLLKFGAQLELASAQGDRPLHVAILNNRAGIAKLLLSKHADPNAHSSTGLSPLHAIVTQEENDDSIDIYKKLIECGANKEEVINGATPLYFAAGQKNLRFVCRLLHDHADPNAPVNVDGFTASILWWAACCNNSAVIVPLLNYGADINFQTQDLWTPLLIAVQNNCIDAVRILLDRGASFSSTEDKDSPLHVAVEHNNEEILKMLLEKEPGIYDRDSQGRTAEDLAREKGFHNLVLILQQYEETHPDCETEDDDIGDEVVHQDDASTGHVQGTIVAPVATPVVHKSEQNKELFGKEKEKAEKVLDANSNESSMVQQQLPKFPIVLPSQTFVMQAVAVDGCYDQANAFMNARKIQQCGAFCQQSSFESAERERAKIKAEEALIQCELARLKQRMAEFEAQKIAFERAECARIEKQDTTQIDNVVRMLYGATYTAAAIADYAVINALSPEGRVAHSGSNNATERAFQAAFSAAFDECSEMVLDSERDFDADVELDSEVGAQVQTVAQEAIGNTHFL